VPEEWAEEYLYETKRVVIDNNVRLHRLEERIRAMQTTLDKILTLLTARASSRSPLMLSSYVVSLIRTGVPLAVGWVLVQLADHLGIGIDDTTSQSLIAALVAILAGLYYALARLVERKWPALTWLLGSSLQPAAYTYTGQHETAPVE
jgi:hypothetical protein